jgi:hypothetical protein
MPTSKGPNVDVIRVSFISEAFKLRRANNLACHPFMKNSSPEYYELGQGTCKSVHVELDQAFDESHCELVITTSTAYFRIRLRNLEPAEAILRFLSDHIGKNEFHELSIRLSESTQLVLVKDPEFIDRFFLKILADSIFIDYTLGGLSGASLMKALQPALQEAREKLA